MTTNERTATVIEAELFSVLDEMAKTEAAIWNESGLGTLAYIEADYIQYEVHNKSMIALENSLTLLKAQHRTLLFELVQWGIKEHELKGIRSSWLTDMTDVREFDN